jgi:ferric iron reductase protein FhuF
MRKKLMNLGLFLLMAIYANAQTPQSVSQLDDKEKESLWSSTYAMVMAVALILLLIIGRKWSKKIHDKRDEMTKDGD